MQFQSYQPLCLGPPTTMPFRSIKTTNKWVNNSNNRQYCRKHAHCLPQWKQSEHPCYYTIQKHLTWWGNYWLLYKAITKNSVVFLPVAVLEVFSRSGHLYSMYWRCRLQKCQICVIHLLKALWLRCAFVAIVNWQRNSSSFEELPSKLRVNNFQVKHLCLVEYKLKYNSYLLTPWSSVLREKLTGSAASQEIPRILWNPKVHYRTHKCPPQLKYNIYIYNTVIHNFIFY